MDMRLQGWLRVYPGLYISSHRSHLRDDICTNSVPYTIAYSVPYVDANGAAYWLSYSIAYSVPDVDTN